MSAKFDRDIMVQKMLNCCKFHKTRCLESREKKPFIRASVVEEVCSGRLPVDKQKNSLLN